MQLLNEHLMPVIDSHFCEENINVICHNSSSFLFAAIGNAGEVPVASDDETGIAGSVTRIADNEIVIADNEIVIADDEIVIADDETQVKTSAGQLNMRGVYLHVLGDALGSVIVIISALIIKYAEGEWTIYVDPVMSILMVCLILKTSVPLLSESSLILLQTVPTHIKIKEVQDRLLDTIDGVLSVHEFHVWQLAGDKIIGKIFCKR